ncbi:MAG TPA: hypothetical protein VIK53_01725 [Verrucomicrobiae bacterium]
MTNEMCEKTIQGFGHRSNAVVLGIAFFFALAGSGLVIFFGGSAIWGILIPLCFITIPSIHYLCQEILNLRKRVEDLEKKKNS